MSTCPMVSTALAQMSGVEILLLDEAQRLSSRERDRLLATVAKGSAGNLRLVLSSHEDLTPLFTQRALPLTICYDAVTEDHLRAVIARRLAYFALTDIPSVTVTPDALSYLWQTYGVNYARWRLLLRFSTVATNRADNGGAVADGGGVDQ